MFKKLLLAVSLMIAGCSSTHNAAPVQPTPEVVITPNPHLRKSVFMQQYKGDTWQISFPDTFVVAVNKPSIIKAFDSDGNMLGFAGQRDGATLEHFTQETLMKFAVKGLHPTAQTTAKVDGWNANFIGYTLSSNKMLSVILFTTGEREYALACICPINQETADMLANVIISIKVSDVKPESK